MYVESHLDFLGNVMPKVWGLITQELNEFLDTCHKTKLSGNVGWNLIKLAFEVFVIKDGLVSLENFNSPTEVSPLLF